MADKVMPFENLFIGSQVHIGTEYRKNKLKSEQSTMNDTIDIFATVPKERIIY